MASVFLSYDREDAGKARSIATALERGGHTVWWDLHVRGGSEFAKAIEKALREADAVIVLWSKQSVDSNWVRDEASAGRDAGKLVPVTIDGTDAPLGFRQFQSINLAKWKGQSRAIEFQQLLHAIGALGGGRVSHTSEAKPRAVRWPVPHARLVAGLVVVVILIAGAFAAWKLLDRGTSVPTVAITASDRSPASASLARDLFVKLGRLQAANPDALEIVEGTARKNLDFVFQVSGSSGAGNASANISLVTRDGGLLWSKDFERPPNEYSDLKQQLGLTAARVLNCASQARKGGDNLDQRTLKLYLHGCASLSELTGTDFRGLVPVFRDVTRRAPSFEDGWGKLVETEAYVVGWETLSRTSPEAQVLRADIQRARKINPRIAEGYFAEGILLPPSDIVGSAELVERAMRDNPEDPLIQAMHGGLLVRVGRLNEAVEAAKRVVELDPLSPDSVSGYIISLTYAGQLEAALKEIGKAEKLWPGTRSLTNAQLRFYLRYGDPKEALRIVRSGVDPGDVVFEPFLLARIDPTKKNVDRAVAHAKAQVDQSPRGSGWYLLALAQFGREDEIYAVLEQRPGMAIWAPEMFFRPEFHRFRHNVRFMALMKRFGMIDYWRKSGKWPDFCFEPDLPYDCKAEAAKLS